MLARLENRKNMRYPMRRRAEVILAPDEQPIRCILHDMSNSGARLYFSDQIERVPGTFTLVLVRDSAHRECEVVWTDGRFVGVKFISPWYGAIEFARRPSQ